MFGYDNVHSVVVNIADHQADGTLPIWKVPTRFAKIEILEAWASCDTTISAGVGTAIWLNLVDRGTAGTATAPVVSGTLGATGTGDWTATVPRDFTISEGTMDGGDYLCLGYNEVGTVAPLNITVGFSYVSGVGA